MDGLSRQPRQRTVDDTGVRAGADSGSAQRLRTLRQQQHDLLVEVVCSQVAAVLGNPRPNDIDPECAFQDLGFDSVKATELLDRLKTVTELELPPTLAFDYPTPDELATHLGQRLSGSAAAAPPVESRVASDEPVAVVGMACRFPGGGGFGGGTVGSGGQRHRRAGGVSERPWLEPGGFVRSRS
nr:phosphopantetheine-binding protein [Mycobacterium riyadhense]